MQVPISLDDAGEVTRLLDAVDFVLTDCDGVIYLNNTIIPGTPEVFQSLRRKGKKVLFVSNNSTRSRKAVMKKLNDMGFEASIDEVFVSAFVAAEYLKSKSFNGLVYIFGCQGIKDELDALDIKNFGVGPDPMSENAKDSLVPSVKPSEKVDAVVVGYDNMISLPKLIKICTYARDVKPALFVATNTDETFPTPDSSVLVPGTGAFVNFVRTVVGRDPVVMGKPNASYWDAITRVHPQIDPKRTLMIGDRLNTDISFGNKNGIAYNLLVETGVHTLKDALEATKDINLHHLVPSHVLPSLNRLNDYL